jgi:hypothetical protein
MHYQIPTRVQNCKHINKFASLQVKNIVALASPNENLDTLYKKGLGTP